MEVLTACMPILSTIFLISIIAKEEFIKFPYSQNLNNNGDFQLLCHFGKVVLLYPQLSLHVFGEG